MRDIYYVIPFWACMIISQMHFLLNKTVTWAWVPWMLLSIWTLALGTGLV